MNRPYNPPGLGWLVAVLVVVLLGLALLGAFPLTLQLVAIAVLLVALAVLL